MYSIELVFLISLFLISYFNGIFCAIPLERPYRIVSNMNATKTLDYGRFNGSNIIKPVYSQVNGKSDSENNDKKDVKNEDMEHKYRTMLNILVGDDNLVSHRTGADSSEKNEAAIRLESRKILSSRDYTSGLNKIHVPAENKSSVKENQMKTKVAPFSELHDKDTPPKLEMSSDGNVDMQDDVLHRKSDIASNLKVNSENIHLHNSTINTNSSTNILNTKTANLPKNISAELNQDLSSNKIVKAGFSTLEILGFVLIPICIGGAVILIVKIYWKRKKYSCIPKSTRITRSELETTPFALDEYDNFLSKEM